MDELLEISEQTGKKLRRSRVTGVYRPSQRGKSTLANIAGRSAMRPSHWEGGGKGSEQSMRFFSPIFLCSELPFLHTQDEMLKMFSMWVVSLCFHVQSTAVPFHGIFKNYKNRPKSDTV